MVKQGIKALKQYEYVWRKHGCYKYRPFPITTEKIEWLDEESVKKLSGTFDLKFITKLGEINRQAFLLQQKIFKLTKMIQKWEKECENWRILYQGHKSYHKNHREEQKYRKTREILKRREKRLTDDRVKVAQKFLELKKRFNTESKSLDMLRRLQRNVNFEEEQKPTSDYFPEMIEPRDGQGTGRDRPAVFCPGPAGQPCGTVPRKFVPVAVPRDTKSVGALSPGPDPGNLQDRTGIPTLSRDNRQSLIEAKKIKSKEVKNPDNFMISALSLLNN